MNAKQTVSHIMTGGTVITMNTQREVIPNGAVAIDGNHIVAVGSHETIADKYTASTVTHAHNKVILPGLINAHSHAGMSLFRGLYDDHTLEDWLEVLWKAEKHLTSKDFSYYGTQLACCEMIRGGITTFADIYYFVDEVARAVSELGMRGLIAQTIIDFPAPDAPTPKDALTLNEEFIKKWQGDELIVPSIGPHAPYTCDTHILQKCKKLSDAYDAPLLIHVAETEQETKTILERYGKRPVPYLSDAGILGNRVVAAHCIYVDDTDLQLLKKHNVSVVHNPNSNMKVVAGIAPVQEWLTHDLNIGLGTDSAASNNSLDLFAEMKAAALLQKIKTNNPKALNAHVVLELATIRGARALGLGDDLGSIEVGKKADIILVDFDGYHTIPVYDVISHLVYTSKSSDVSTVMINGKIVMHNKNITTLPNKQLLYEKVREYQDKLHKLCCK